MGYTKDELINNARNIIDQLTKKHNIKAAYIFGSYSKGNASEYSDIDVAVVVDKIRNGSPFWLRLPANWQARRVNEAFEIFHEAQKQNSLFKVVCFSETEFIWLRLDASPRRVNEEEEVIKHIKKDGIKIY